MSAKNTNNTKKPASNNYILFIIIAILALFSTSNFLQPKPANVAYSYQVEHLVNLGLTKEELNRKIAINTQLVDFSGQFHETLSEESQQRYRFLSLLDQKQDLMEKRDDIADSLKALQENIIDVGAWLLKVAGEPVDEAHPYMVIEPLYDRPYRQNRILITKISEREGITLAQLENALAQLRHQENLPLSAFSQVNHQIEDLIDELRSPYIGIGNEAMKQQLKECAQTVATLRNEPSSVPSALLEKYSQILGTLRTLLQGLLQPKANETMQGLRSVRKYRETMVEYHLIVDQLDTLSLDVDALRPKVEEVIWFFNNQELTTRMLERQDPQNFHSWFLLAKKEWDDFSYNKGLAFDAPDQPRNEVLDKKFRSQEPPLNYFGYLFPFIFAGGLLFLLYMLFARQMKGLGNNALSFGKSPARLMEKSDNKITFADVAGIEEAKEELQEIVDFLKSPQKFTALGASIPKGVLCVGPPGTGKTLIARAVAGEADRPFFSISGSDFVEMFVGVGASRIRDLFDQGRKQAPCIIFIDEIDAVGRHRGVGMGGGHDEREQTLNQLLVEMDGFDPTEGIIIMAATNRPDVLDKALLRPGRFDRRVIIGLPDMKGRFEILKVHAKKIKLAADADLLYIAQSTPGSSGADLKNILNEAALLAARRDKKEITSVELKEACDKVRFGKERRSLEIDEKEKRTTAYHEAGHAIVALSVSHTNELEKISIVPRGMALGATYFLPQKNRVSYWRKELIAELAVLMGGRCAEELFLSDGCSGAKQDIEQATSIARAMVCEWGMSSLGMIAYDEGQANAYGQSQPRTYSNETALAIDQEIKKLIGSAYEAAIAILTEKEAAIHLMSQMLLEFESLDADDAREILEGRWDIEAKRAKLSLLIQIAHQQSNAHTTDSAEKINPTP